MIATVVNLPQDMIDSLPPKRYSETCTDGDFNCEHWVHGTRSPEGNAILNPAFAQFLEDRAHKA